MAYTREDAQSVHARRLKDIDEQLNQGLALYRYEMKLATFGIGGLAVFILLILVLYRDHMGPHWLYGAAILTVGIVMTLLLQIARKMILGWAEELGKEVKTAEERENTRYERELDQIQ